MTTGFSSLLPEGALAQDPALLWSAYVSADPLLSGIYITLALSAAVWILSVATGNYSWVDKLWSLTPVAFAWHFALHDYWTTHVLPGSRLLTMAVLCTFWGVRLTFNFARKGGYAWHGEDYRWPYLRARMHWTLFQVFNVVFISLYQNVLIFLFTLPAYAAWVAEAQGNGALRSIDFLAAFLFFSFLILETVADEHQFAFQSEKYRLIGEKKTLTGDFKRGFLTSGIFKYSRHPNFFAEQAIWSSYYVFSIGASNQPLNWTITGAVLLILLFQGSTWFTEHITSEKYAAYQEYKKTTSRLIPWFPGKPLKQE